MTKFKKGDKFIPRKPKANTTILAWPPEMDIYDGATLEVSDINVGCLKARESIWLFHPNWCEKVEENQSVEASEMVAENHIPEVRKMVESSEIPNNQEHIVEANKMIDWEQRRYELAKQLIAAQVNGIYVSQVSWDYQGEVKAAIECADEMIKQLKEQ